MQHHPSKLTAEFLKAVGDYMLVETPLAQADVCLVFGNNKHPDHLAEHAAELYHQGYFPLIVVSGGPVTDDGRTEAHRMHDVLVSKGVPETAILIEDKAKNSGENVAYSKALLEEKFGVDKIKSILAIGHIHASRRFLMTLERHWPEALKMFSTNNCYGVPKEEWHTHSGFKNMVLAEYGKIPDYKARDFIREIHPDKMAEGILALPKPSPRRNPPSL